MIDISIAAASASVLNRAIRIQALINIKKFLLLIIYLYQLFLNTIVFVVPANYLYQ